MDDKKTWTENERDALELADKLDPILDEWIKTLEDKSLQEKVEIPPFFNAWKGAPEPGDKLSLVEQLQQLKYKEAKNTPKELANNYKKDGNFYYKYEKYRVAIFVYTEGIRTNCEDNDLMAQLYNNRAAAHFMLQNYRSCLNNCKMALNLKSQYPKALKRAAICSFRIKDYNQCKDLCNKFLNDSPNDEEILQLKSTAKELVGREEEKLEKKFNEENKKLIEAISKKGINLELTNVGDKLELKNKVHFDEKNKLVWPVMILYPETECMIQNFHEDTLLVEQLKELFKEPPEWDTERRYTVENINVYFKGKNKYSFHKVDINLTLDKILQDKQFMVCGGTPAFYIFVKSSEEEKSVLEKSEYLNIAAQFVA